MNGRKKICVINGSASENSSNARLLSLLAELAKDLHFSYQDLKKLPPFNAEQSIADTPLSVSDFRAQIENADGVLICTPEYIFSIPSALKNAFEWCASTVVFLDKPMALITASANGEKGHEELQLIVKTLGGNFTEATTLLITGIKAKINQQAILQDAPTLININKLLDALRVSLGLN